MNHDDGSPVSFGKREDMDNGGDPSKRDIKPNMKPLNRVSRACNACRRQKMRCEGAENPPCKRCRNANLECQFEKPSREASLTGEAGLERIRSLESQVAEIRQAQVGVQSSLDEILAYVRGGSAPPSRSQPYQPQPHYVQQSPVHSSPSMHSQATPTPNPAHLIVDTSQHGMPPPQGQHSAYQPIQSNQRTPSENYRSPPPSASSQGSHMHAAQQLTPQGGYPHSYQGGGQGQGGQNLPPISSIQHGMGPVHSMRYHSNEHQQQHPHVPGVSSSLKRQGVSLSNATSADSSDVDEDEGELPRQGMVAPWEVLRGLADVALERAQKENFNDSAPPSRARTPSPPAEKQSRPMKRRKLDPQLARPAFPDVVTKGIISEPEARELFRIFYHGCSTFLSVFDQAFDTFDNLHERSPFAVNCICMIAALVRDKGGKPSETYKKCQEEVYAISQATLFSSVTRLEAVQSMLLVAGWSENGWLPGGHAVRMAFELNMHNCWPKLLKRMRAGKAHTYPDDRSLVASVRTWFSLYIFEHQISYGTGRPAILKDDESIQDCRELLNHPLAVPDDMRLVSTLELMAVRERVNNKLSPMDRPIDDLTFRVLHEADLEFQTWYRNWDAPFSQRYEDAAFYRQSLQVQHFHAELFHNANALRNIHGPEDVQSMPHAQRELATRSIRIAKQCLDITLNSPAYREGMKYAVHYTHATATFTASLLLRLSRLFPEECPIDEARNVVQRLAALMSEIPAKRYSLTLKLMLKRAKQRRQASLTRSPTVSNQARPQPLHSNSTGSTGSFSGRHPDTFSPTYQSFSPDMPPPQMIGGGLPPHLMGDAANLENIWRGFETAPADQVPMWLNDQALGGNAFAHNGMNAFVIAPDYMSQQQIW